MKYLRRKSYLVSLLVFCLVFSYKAIDINRNLSCRRALTPTLSSETVFSSRAPVLVTETTSFSRTPKAQVSYFEFNPDDKEYNIGAFVDSIARGGGIYANRSTNKIKISKDVLPQILAVLPNLEVTDEGDYVTTPLSNFGKLRAAIPDFPGAQGAIYQEQAPGNIVAIFPGACNVGWNDWFISGVKDADGSLKLYYPKVEPIENKIYSCIVGFKNGDVKILDLKVERDTANPDVAAKVFIASDVSKTDISKDITWFTFGQKVLNNGNVTDVVDIANQFNDLRHLIDFPYIRYNGEKVQFGLDEMWDEVVDNGVENRITKDMLVYKALSENGVVKLSTEPLVRLLGQEVEGLSQPEIIKKIEGLIKKSGYQKAADADNVKPGEFWVKSAQKVEINYRRGIYPHIAAGVKDDGTIIFAFFEGKTALIGPTVEEAAEFLKNHGAKDVLLLGNGGDVALNLANQPAVPSSVNRDNFIGYIYIADNSSELKSVENFIKQNAKDIVTTQDTEYGHGIIDVNKIAQQLGLSPDLAAEYLRSPYMAGDPVIRIGGVIRPALGDAIAADTSMIKGLITKKLAELLNSHFGQSNAAVMYKDEIAAAVEKFVEEKQKYREYEFINLIETDEDNRPVFNADGTPKILENIAQYDTFLHIEGNWHPTVHVMVIDKSGNVLMQEKNNGQIDIASSGHLAVGEGLEKGAVRELQEEVLHLGVHEEGLFRVGSFMKIGGGYTPTLKKITGKEITGERFKNNIYYGPSGTVYNKEVSTLYVYRVDEIKEIDGKIVIRIGDKKYEPAPGEGKELLIKTIAELGEDINSSQGGYKGTPMQYFRPSNVWNQVRKALIEAGFAADVLPENWPNQIK